MTWTAVLPLFAAAISIASADLSAPAAWGAMNLTLIYNAPNSTMFWGPFDMPARITRQRMRVVQGGFVGFNFWMLRESQFTEFLANRTFDFVNAPPSAVVSGAGNGTPLNVTELVLGPSWTANETKAYFVLHYGSRRAGPPDSSFYPPGGPIDVAWDDLSVITGPAANQLAPGQPCGRRAVNNGPGQFLAAPLVKTSTNEAMFRSETASFIKNGIATPAIVTALGYKDLLATGQYNLSRNHAACFQNNLCKTLWDDALGPYYAVLSVTGGSGLVVFNYYLNEGALKSQCINATAGVSPSGVATTIAGSTASAGVSATTTTNTGSTASPGSSDSGVTGDASTPTHSILPLAIALFFASKF